ncbi:MAG: CinA family protein [Rhodoblastus sp.]|nr:MAG: CinA family protein [Rhodoblastus sp.]
MTPASLEAARATLEAARAKGLKIVTAESCTGGLVSAALTDVAGSSDVMDRGFITYSNESKTGLLLVNSHVLITHGAVSAPVAQAMAVGALSRSRADVAVAVTGIAGPGGGSEAKPIGLVHFACARRGHPTRLVERRFGDLGRDKVREAAAAQALALLHDACVA